MTEKDGQPAHIRLQDLTDEEAIFKAVRNQCIQSPLTIIPLALAAGTLLLTGAFSWGFFGVFAAVVLGVVGAAAFVFNLWIRGETLAQRHLRRLMERMQQDRHAALADVATMCANIGLPEAAKEARELAAAFSQYSGFLETRAGSTLGAAVGQRLELAESARAAGVAHLRRAAEIHLALSGIDIARLREESSAWQRGKEAPTANHAVLDSMIAAHARQISRYEQLAVMRDELIARSNELEAAVKSAYLADAARPDLVTDHQLDDPAARLSSVIAAAEAAEEDMRELLREAGQVSTERNQ